MTRPVTLAIAGVALTGLLFWAFLETAPDREPAGGPPKGPVETRPPVKKHDPQPVADRLQALMDAGDYEAAGQLAHQSFEDGKQYHQWLRQALAHWFKKHPRRFPEWLKAIAELGVPGEPMSARGPITLLKKYLPAVWPIYEPEAATKWALSLPHEFDRSSALHDVMKTWAGVDLKAATLRARSLKDSGWALAGVVRALAPKDPKEARLLAETIEDDNARYSAFVDVAREMARARPEEGAALAEGLEDEWGRHRAQEEVAKIWAGKDPDKAIAWARGLAEPGESAAALCSAALAMIATTPRKAAEVIDSIEPRWMLRRSALRTLVCDWSEADPPAAAAWLETRPPGKERSRDVNTAAHYWAASDPKKAAAWIGSLEDATPRTYDVVARVWGKADPKAAAEWTKTIENAENRQFAASTVGWLWVETDPVAAVDFVRSLPTAVQQSMLKKVPVLRKYIKVNVPDSDEVF